MYLSLNVNNQKRLILCMRPFSWFLRKNWYAKRWGQKSYEDTPEAEILYLIDLGAITFGYSVPVKQRVSNSLSH